MVDTIAQKREERLSNSLERLFSAAMEYRHHKDSIESVKDSFDNALKDAYKTLQELYYGQRPKGF